jgi:hypothetical protein
MSAVRKIAVVVLAFLLSGCGSAVVWTETPSGPPRGDIDGAVLTYALAEGHVSIQAQLKSGDLSLTTDQKVVGQADPRHMYQLIYNHSRISLDDISIQLNAGLVTSITTTTTDQTVQIIQGVTSLLSQVSATQAAIAKAAKTELAPPVTPPCADMQVTYVRNITHDDGETFVTQSGTTGCTIQFTVDQILVSRLPLGVRGFAAPDENGVPVADVCRNDYVFCFRLGSMYRIRVSAVVVKDRTPIKGTSVSLAPFTVAGPDASQLGFVRFNRRAFVANKTAVTFDGTGLLSGFAATNPSEVLGFIALPTAIAAGVAAAVAIH